jgi:hypothetical protein
MDCLSKANTECSHDALGVLRLVHIEQGAQNMADKILDVPIKGYLLLGC